MTPWKTVTCSTENLFSHEQKAIAKVFLLNNSLLVQACFKMSTGLPRWASWAGHFSLSGANPRILPAILDTWSKFPQIIYISIWVRWITKRKSSRGFFCNQNVKKGGNFSLQRKPFQYNFSITVRFRDATQFNRLQLYLGMVIGIQ